MTLQRFWTTKQVADFFSITPRTVTRLINDKKLHAFRFGKAYRIHKLQLIEFMNANAHGDIDVDEDLNFYIGKTGNKV